jgi:hypothetical protein
VLRQHLLVAQQVDKAADNGDIYASLLWKDVKDDDDYIVALDEDDELAGLSDDEEAAHWFAELLTDESDSE